MGLKSPSCLFLRVKIVCNSILFPIDPSRSLWAAGTRHQLRNFEYEQYQANSRRSRTSTLFLKRVWFEMEESSWTGYLNKMSESEFLESRISYISSNLRPGTDGGLKIQFLTSNGQGGLSRSQIRNRNATFKVSVWSWKLDFQFFVKFLNSSQFLSFDM